MRSPNQPPHPPRRRPSDDPRRIERYVCRPTSGKSRDLCRTERELSPSREGCRRSSRGNRFAQTVSICRHLRDRAPKPTIQNMRDRGIDTGSPDVVIYRGPRQRRCRWRRVKVGGPRTVLQARPKPAKSSEDSGSLSGSGARSTGISPTWRVKVLSRLPIMKTEEHEAPAGPTTDTGLGVAEHRKPAHSPSASRVGFCASYRRKWR